MRIGRVIALLAGTVLTLIGLMVSVLSVPALIVVGFDDTLDTGTQRLASPTAAIASAEASLGDETLPDRKRSAEETWDLRLRAAAAEGQELFVGIGPAEEVDAYLDQVAWDKVSVFAYERFSTDATRVDFERLGAAGGPSELPAPADQDFWTVSDSGTDVSLDWDYREGHHTVVLMNADGSTGVAADGAVRLEIPHLGLILAAVAGTGLVLLLVGLAVLLLALRALRSANRHPGPAAAASP
ncbi:MAG TPA: hypothetical protein VGO78_15280 [Acidimicrobiales bacterium]|nr:hypothetical protein [Acidimicrobiales bacterium]